MIPCDDCGTFLGPLDGVFYCLRCQETRRILGVPSDGQTWTETRLAEADAMAAWARRKDPPPRR